MLCSECGIGPVTSGGYGLCSACYQVFDIEMKEWLDKQGGL